MALTAGRQSSTTTPVTPREVKDSQAIANAQELAAQQQLPDIASTILGTPGMDVPGMDPQQASFLAQLQGNAMSSPDRDAARQQLQALTSGPLGSSPETVAGMKAYQDLVAPQIASDSALRGTAGGGQGIEALALGQTAAAVPLLQDEMQRREAAIGQYASLGNDQQQALAQALEASGLPREVALQQAAAIFQQQMQQNQETLQFQTNPSAWFQQQIGQHQVGAKQLGAIDIMGSVVQGAEGPAANIISGGGK